MSNLASPVPYLLGRELGLVQDLRPEFFNKRLNVAKNLYRRDLVCHFGCVNAIEFSSNGELLVSGGDDRRVMLWQLGQAILDHGEPECMKAVHQSNIFCLGFTRDNQKVYSGGNDDIVIVHDLESKCPLDMLQHQRAICSLSIDPFNDRIVATAGNDGRLLVFDTRHTVREPLVVARSRKAFHGVMFHPLQDELLVSANAKDGVALWDLRSTKRPVIRYTGANGNCQSCMSVRFNSSGSHVLALRRRLAPVLYDVESSEPVAEFYHPDYYNSCTMKSCCFAGEDDQFVLSGSDDFNLYMWKVPEKGIGSDTVVEPPHIVLYGHRSIVNQVRYNPKYCLLASSGVEKIIKVWSGMQFPNMRGSLMEEAKGSDNPREMYTHEGYVSLVHHTGQFMSHNYSDQSTEEDPRMMAFFDSLVQRELECLAEETDSLNGSSSGCSARGRDSDSSDNDQPEADFSPVQRRRANPNGNIRQRIHNRIARILASRYFTNTRTQKRGSHSRSKQNRKPSRKSMSGVVAKGKRAPVRRARGQRRPIARVNLPSVYNLARHSRISAPSSERTDSDEPSRGLYGNSGRVIRPLRRRINLTRSAKRKSKVTSHRKAMNARNNQDSSDNNNFNNLDSFEDNLAQPSTSSGYRGQNTPTLFRIAEVDSDDDQSSSRPISPLNQDNPVPPDNSTPVNGSRALSVSPSVEPVRPDRNSPPRPDTLRKRPRRYGRLGLQMSDSSDTTTPEDSASLSSIVSYNQTVARLMNETNESELESSCSTEGSVGPRTRSARGVRGAAGGGAAAAGGTARALPPPPPHVADDPEYVANKVRQRFKRARQIYENVSLYFESDSN